jgi:thiosulfate reductase cytochrome b subunit
MESAHPQLATPDSDTSADPRHSLLVRITHWITTFSFLALLVSGVAILLAHPRLYWGETGAVGTPSLIDLPLPFVLVRQSGWGRSLHFLSAWVFVLTGLLYVLFGLVTGHFGRRLLPEKVDLTWRAISGVVAAHVRLQRRAEDSLTYNVLQRFTYLAVIFGLCPLIIWSGLAMSPALTSVVSGLVTALNGHQSARTIHFMASVALLLFFVVHIAMVWLAGFTNRVRSMLTGQAAARTGNG